MTQSQPITLLELNNRLARTINAAQGVQNVWVIAETSDLRQSGAHCYLELIDKDPFTGQTRARLRATIWASVFNRINSTFREATGSNLASDIKIMAQLTATFHPIYGLSANITDINPEYTLGDLLRRRREMIARLEKEGIINNNKSLQWPQVAWRIAVISAQGAAGYGDFINQLYTNRLNLRFHTTLFTASLQGDNTAPSIINALEQIAASDTQFDCVVIIRGGGATGDLVAFDNYQLAANIALFPIPVIVGIGHERDVTLLDYVANMRVKTPTAAAEWLIAHGAEALENLRLIGAEILDTVTNRINLASRKLELFAGQIPEMLRNIIARNHQRLTEGIEQQLTSNIVTIIKQRRERIEALSHLIDALSPQATLRRGFSITRVNGIAISNSDQVPDGATVETTLANGILITKKQ